MNELQNFIFKVIINIFKIEDIEQFYKRSEIRYGILNYVAKYSLARDKYYVTKECLEHLKNLNLITKKGLRRGSKSKKTNLLMSIQYLLMLLQTNYLKIEKIKSL